MISIKLDQLTKKYQDIHVQYLDIVNYDIARENICGYIFFLSRKMKENEECNAAISDKINMLIYIRDNLQIEDIENVSLVLKEIIPEYKSEISAQIDHNSAE